MHNIWANQYVMWVQKVSFLALSVIVRTKWSLWLVVPSPSVKLLQHVQIPIYFSKSIHRKCLPDLSSEPPPRRLCPTPCSPPESLAEWNSSTRPRVSVSSPPLTDPTICSLTGPTWRAMASRASLVWIQIPRLLFVKASYLLHLFCLVDDEEVEFEVATDEANNKQFAKEITGINGALLACQKPRERREFSERRPSGGHKGRDQY